MSERSERRKLRKEARSYGMTVGRGLSAGELDARIQAKVSADVVKGECSLCRGPIHYTPCR